MNVTVVCMNVACNVIADAATNIYLRVAFCVTNEASIEHSGSARQLKMSDELVFRFEVPAEGLSLRSVALVKGVPELRFSISPKVPTITEQDVATAIRLAAENKRPEFFYITVPFDHPFYGRQYKYYSPRWLRNTGIGDLLSEADWKMKCLCVGARSDESKSRFWAWQETSQFDGRLASQLDFSDDNPNSG